MQILTADTNSKKVTAKIQQPIQKLLFDVTIAGDASAVDRVARFHSKLGGIYATITRRIAGGKTVDIAINRPLSELLEIDAQHTNTYIKLTPNGTTDMKVEASLNLGGLGSIASNSEEFVEVVIDLGSATDLTCVVTGKTTDLAGKGNLYFQTLSTLANQSNSFPLEGRVLKIALPTSLTRLFVSSRTGIDVDLSLSELKKDLMDTTGISYIDAGVPKEASKWFVYAFSEYQNKVNITTSDANTVYLLKQY